MKQRGRILRDTNSGSGLITVGGRQLQFQLEGQWRSAVAPAVNMVVDVELNAAGEIVAVQAVDQTQLAKEQADVALQMAREKGGQALQLGGEVAKELSARFGAKLLISVGLLIIGWFLMNTITINIMASLQKGFTFWNILGLMNDPAGAMQAMQYGGNSSAGLYGVIAVIALAGPFLGHFWKDPRAQLGAAMPLVWMLLVVLILLINIRHGVNSAQASADAFGGAAAQQMLNQMATELMKSVLQAMSIGLGFYLSVAVSLYLAFQGVKNYLVAKATVAHSI